MSVFEAPSAGKTVRIFLCGDVMIGRGIDQILPRPCPPLLHEPYLASAMDYVKLAEQASGRITAPVDLSYPWGASLEKLESRRPDICIANLETSATTSEDYEAKGINYRVSPANAACLRSLGVDICALANNHVLDWGQGGLLETLDTLERLGIRTAGAGRNLKEAQEPAVFPLPGRGRAVVFSFALPSGGTPRHWEATRDRPGVNFLPDLSGESLDHACDIIGASRKPDDLAVVSLHWGPNWSYEVPEEQRLFAHGLMDRAEVRIVHGHSSHHPKAIEIYRDRLILYGCGDFLNDYEGIGGDETYRGDLSLMFFADIDADNGELVALELAPLKVRRLRLEAASPEDAEWMAQKLDSESVPFGVRVRKIARDSLRAEPAL
ncbi:CapA family protein [Methylocystis heyeri]|uniref:Poly-gamma-glutamate biosynthesis protein n=1 Tax=Methylocystis heyeri TaxID=391905 RepID=A0A6B8K9A2_9HYPH|nr:CapA family protein [Methylocystis heyeri]QGM44419.1 poly-gamma-glutamate biosynthesis protein [Methylocystis heyeri]